MTSPKNEISYNNNESSYNSNTLSSSIFSPVTQMLTSKIISVKNRILNGDIELNRIYTEEEDQLITPEMKLLSLSMSNLYSNFLLDLAPVQRPKSKILIRKIKLNSNTMKEKDIKILNNSSSQQIISPNTIINQTKNKHVTLTKPEKFNINIFRETKSTFRSISKEIDKRTKKEFKIAKKNFTFMKFKNPFLPCHDMNVNSKDKQKVVDSINLPFLNPKTLQRNNISTGKPLIGLLRISREVKTIDNTNKSFVENQFGNSSKRESKNRGVSASFNKSLKRNASALMFEKIKI